VKIVKGNILYFIKGCDAVKKLALLSLVLIFMFTLFAGTAQTAEEAKEGQQFLADKHKNLGVECSGCHRESPPKQMPGSDVCMGCHGDAAKISEKTSKLDTNPHDTHMGEMDCHQCHKGHQRSVSVCNQCHTFDMKVP
jgi:fumarate reductase flavoprotein subunit